jgi:hypothetical protein
MPLVLKMASLQQKSWYVLPLMKEAMPVKLELHTKVVFSQPVVIVYFMLVSKLQLFLFFVPQL